MNRQKWIVLALVLALTGGTAFFLSGLKAGRRLGKPGLRLVEKPVYDLQTNIVGKTTVDLPVNVLDYGSQPLTVSSLEVKTLPKDTTFGRRHYTNDARLFMDVSVVLMGTDRTSIHKPQICLEGQGWKIDKSELLAIRMTRPQSYDLPVMKLTASKNFKKTADGPIFTLRATFVYWFVSENRLTAQHKERMWGSAKDLVLTGVLPRWAYVSYLSVCRPGQEEATYNHMKEFIAASVPEFQLVSGSMTAAAGPATKVVLK